MKEYKARVALDKFLNYPGHHDSAFVRVYVEDTTERDIDRKNPTGYEGNPNPRLVFEVADCSNRINLYFELDSPEHRRNSFHKIDTLIEALSAFRDGLVAESTLYKRRQRKIDAYKEAKAANKKDTASKSVSQFEEERRAKELAVEVDGRSMAPEEFFDWLDKK